MRPTSSSTLQLPTLNRIHDMHSKFVYVAIVLGMTLVFGSCAATPSSTEPRGEVIMLAHADCKDIQLSLRKINDRDERGHKLVVVAHAETNSILLSGTPEQVSLAKDLIARLDRGNK